MLERTGNGEIHKFVFNHAPLILSRRESSSAREGLVLPQSDFSGKMGGSLHYSYNISLGIYLANIVLGKTKKSYYRLC